MTISLESNAHSLFSEAVHLDHQLCETQDLDRGGELTKELLEVRVAFFLRMAKIMLMDGKDETCKELHTEWRSLVIFQLGLGVDVDLDAFERYDRMFVRELGLKLSDLAAGVDH